MARKAGTNGRSSTLQATVLLLPPDSVIEALTETRRNSKKRAQSASGTLSDAINKAEEKHLDRTAHALACKLDALDDEKLHVVYFHLMHYVEVLGVVKRATAQEEMFAAGETGQAPKNGKGDDDESKVTRIGAAARKVAEQAGASLHDD